VIERVFLQKGSKLARMRFRWRGKSLTRLSCRLVH
jgi:hypothetical protein